MSKIFIIQLTPRQEKIISQACEIQLNDIVKLHVEGHQELTEYLEEYEDAGEITDELLQKTYTFENLKVSPMTVNELDRHHCIVLAFIISECLNKKLYPNSKQSLIAKIQNRIELLTPQLN